MISITPFERKNEESFFNKFKFNSDIIDDINNAFCEKLKSKGGYELIFPTKNPINIYKRYVYIIYKKFYYSRIKYNNSNTIK